MIVTINPSQLKGSVQAPASKSSMQRILAAALLHHGTTIIHNPGHSDDDRIAAGIIQALGAELDHTSPAVIVRSSFLEKKEPGKKIKETPLEIYCGESGLSIRMFTLLAALLDRDVIITGAGSLLNRPMHFFDEVFPELGVEVESEQGKLPIKIHGSLKPANIEIDGSLSSQFLTGLLMAYSVSNAENISIKVNDLKSKPYIDLTLDVMKQFEMIIPENREYKEFFFSQRPSPSLHPESILIPHGKHKTINVEVESDWSSAAFLLVAGAIAGPINVTGLDLSSSQPDKAILDALMLANAGLAVEAKGIKVHPSDMSAFDFDATDCPDLFPPLVALASYCNGVSSIKGVHRLIHKESDRSLSLSEEFGKMGVTVKFNNDNMLIEGNPLLNGATVTAHHDHRIAMACTVAALGARGETILHDAEAVSKSYPDFYEHLKKLGADVSLDNKINLHE